MIHPLAQEIADFIHTDTWQATEAEFNRLALALFAHQFAGNAPFRRLCQAEAITPDTVERWSDVPAAPAQAFKRFALSCVPASEAAAVFHSSGTTGAQTSRHYLSEDALALYETSLDRGFALAVPERPAVLWALMPPPEAAPHSSLTHMLATLRAERFFWEDDASLVSALRGARQPVLLFGTAFAFVQLFDGTEETWRLPDGSMVVETGGFKGRTREVTREELYGLFQSRLGVSPAHCLSEYGMCEMASQFYGYGLEPVKRGPHWVRTRAIDPETGGDARPGQAGLLRHCDLANFNSVMTLQTQDLGTRTEDGFILHGRAPDADLRGCSLTVEDLWDIALMLQAAVVDSLAEFARRWRDPTDPFRREAETVTEPFPFAMTRLSLDALLASLGEGELWRLIESEGVRDAHGPAQIAHVIAGNTPLLAWTSLLRALLMRSTSRVKLPSGDAARWGWLFRDSLAAVCPDLARAVTLEQWAGGEGERERDFCAGADLVLAYGNDGTIAALRAVCPPGTALLGYGHRVSFGLVLRGADWGAAASGLATDVLLYDQGGCLSPQTVFVEGGAGAAQEFAAGLADALAGVVPTYPLPRRSPRAAMVVREARALARMEDHTCLWADRDLRWTVVARSWREFAPSPTYGVVSVQPLPSLRDLPLALVPVQDHLQGCAVAGDDGIPLQRLLPAISYVCPPGRLQAPPLSWPQDGVPPLRSLHAGMFRKFTRCA